MKIALLGYGKMGREIEKIALERGHDIVLKITSNNSEELTKESLQKADAAIEFSKPEAALDNMRSCLDAGIPAIVGTTGWYDKIGEVKRETENKSGTILYASNFSMGVNIFFALNRQLAKLMKEQPAYEVGVEETHHTQKLDAPSGTAITIAQDILDQLPGKQEWVNHKNSKDYELPVISHRIENVPGTHKVKYSSGIDDIEITHTAHNRKGFALGSIIAAEWTKGKKGFFTMKDVLNID